MPEPNEGVQGRHGNLQSWLRIAQGARPKIYSGVFAGSENSPSYWLEVFFSAGIATFGLVENSPAVIIGAMLISPLMGPIMATGLALAIGDLYLGIKAIFNLLASVTASIAFAGFLVWLLPFHSATSEVISRTKPNLLDLGIALLSGFAGSVVVCRGGSEGAMALPGVAIAVALMPPLCTMGFGLGSGVNLDIMGGSGLLFLTNLVAIVASAFVIFLMVGMSTPEVEQRALASRGDGALARMLARGPVAGMLSGGSQLGWRVLMILVLLGSIFVPLRRALLQVASETRARAAVQQGLARLVPSGLIVSEQVDVDPSHIEIHLISTRSIPDSKVAEVRQDLMRQTGRSVEISVEAVASQSAIAALMERLHPLTVVPEVPKQETLADMQQKLLKMVGPAIQQIWPSSDAPIQDFDVAIGASGFTIDVHYQAVNKLGDVPLHVILQSLRAKLGEPNLALNAVRVQPPGPVKGGPTSKKPRPSLEREP